MNRKEFLEILRSQLAGHMQEGKAAAHVRYYEDYIQSQVRGGRTEQEVLDQLGDPRLIAKTLIDTARSRRRGFPGRPSRPASHSRSARARRGRRPSRRSGGKKFWTFQPGQVSLL